MTTYRYDYSITFRPSPDWRDNLCHACRTPFEEGREMHICRPSSRYMAYARHCTECASGIGLDARTHNLIVIN